MSGINYLIGEFGGKHHNYKIGLRLAGSKNTTVALETRHALEYFHPSIIILLGICGGVKDVDIGDVVVGTKAYDYEAGKETENGFVSRPEVYRYDHELIQFAQFISQEGKWAKKFRPKKPNVVFGPIASGNKVIASTKSQTYQRLKFHYNDTTAIEMEASGFAEAVYPFLRYTRAINIRGVSDLLNDKSLSDSLGHQKSAVTHAASFVFEMLKQLNFEKYKILNMKPKDLVSEVVSLLFPILKLDAIKDIGNEFKEATNNSIKEIWEKVRPIFIEEMEGLSKEELQNEETKIEIRGAIKSSLKNKLNQEESLRRELLKLVSNTKSKKQKPKVTNQAKVNGNNNTTIVGSTITGRNKIINHGK